LYFQGEKYLSTGDSRELVHVLVLDEELVDIVQIFENDDSGIAVQMLLRNCNAILHVKLSFLPLSTLLNPTAPIMDKSANAHDKTQTSRIYIYLDSSYLIKRRCCLVCEYISDRWNYRRFHFTSCTNHINGFLRGLDNLSTARNCIALKSTN
jgi:hypothetical protein